MATAALPAGRRPATPRVRRALAAAAVTVRTLRGALAAGSRHFELRALADSPLTTAGFGLVDYAVFRFSFSVGFMVTGLSLVLLEYLIASE